MTDTLDDLKSLLRFLELPADDPASQVRLARVQVVLAIKRIRLRRFRNRALREACERAEAERG